METVRVNIAYRPLRIAWAIHSSDFDAYRRAVRYSHALWGGRYNPIIFADHEEGADKLIDLFRVDVIIAVGDSDAVMEFPKKYRHLIKPFMFEEVFMMDRTDSRPWSNVLDVYNALTHLHNKPEWKAIKDRGVLLYNWELDDPLADVFLSQFGSYPSPDEVGTDYRKIYLDASDGKEMPLSPLSPIPAEAIDHPGISYLSRHSLERHYSISPRHESPGFFVGSVSNLDDLVCHWNLRACDIPLWFVDPTHQERYSELVPAWDKAMREMVANYRHEWDRNVLLWSRQADDSRLGNLFNKDRYMFHHVSDTTWNRLNIMPPTMYFGEASVLGVVISENGKPKVSFPLSDRPYNGDIYFNHQLLVASVSLIGGLYGDEQHTFRAPYLPELNEFYARSMHFDYNKLRVEPDRVGIVIDAADHDSFLSALKVEALMGRVLEMAGFNAKMSSAGLLTRQLITRLGGLQGARVFKIPGVRKLINTYGPGHAFLKKNALSLIGGKDPDNPDANFNDHSDLHIGRPRPRGTKLSKDDVFCHLVDKGLYRIGAELLCPSCNMKSWIPLDSLKHQITCDLCGHSYDATGQLVTNEKWHYRRSGILGFEKNALGAIPVSLTLQQLDSGFHGALDGNIYSPSLDLSPKDGGNPCEVDFVWLISRAFPRKTVVIIGECKDKGPITDTDMETMKRVADSLPKKRFKTFIVLSQLTTFSPEQVEYAKSLNDRRRQRAILLTARELEPYFMYERTQKTVDARIENLSGRPEGMAEATAHIFFSEKQGRPSMPLEE